MISRHWVQEDQRENLVQEQTQEEQQEEEGNVHAMKHGSGESLAVRNFDMYR